MFAVEYIESLRFERANDDGTKTIFSIEEPKSIGLTNPRSILTGKYGVQIGGVNHCVHRNIPLKKVRRSA